LGRRPLATISQNSLVREDDRAERWRDLDSGYWIGFDFDSSNGEFTRREDQRKSDRNGRPSSTRRDLYLSVQAKQLNRFAELDEKARGRRA